MRGILITDGVIVQTLNGLINVIKQEKTSFKLIAPQVGGVKASDGKMIAADEKLVVVRRIFVRPIFHSNRRT